MLSAASAFGQQFVAAGSGALGGDAGRLLDDTVELVHAVLKLLLFLEEFELAVIQRSPGFAGAAA
jgi:hypothetical protein